jgi:hypothetical protein
MRRLIDWPLLTWMLRPVLPVSLVAMVVALAYVLSRHEPLDTKDGWAGAFIVVHGCLVVMRLGRTTAGPFAFLYTRGYSRDRLWAHTMLTTLAAVVVVWVPAALTIWLGLRSNYQDVLRQSPFFPIMAPLETAVPLVWLAAYVVLLAVLHYAWIRQAQPTRGGAAGPLMVAGLVVAGLSIFNAGQIEQPVYWIIWIGCVVVTVAALWGGLRLHRRIEVRA